MPGRGGTCPALTPLSAGVLCPNPVTTLDVVAENVPQRQTFVRLIGFLRPYKWSLAASVLLAIGSQAAGLSIPWLTGYAIDHALPDKDNALLTWIVVLVAVMGLLKAL